MADVPSRAGSPAAVLFLKATAKKEVFIPTFTRRNGVVVPGHYAMVHVSDDHDTHKVLSGKGTHSQKTAHAKLSKQKWFQDLPHEHQLHVLLEHATHIQNKASAAAVLSTFKKKILAGQKPTTAEWKGFAAAPLDKQQALVAEFEDAGKEAAFAEGFGAHLAAHHAQGPAAAEPSSAQAKPEATPTPESKPESKPKAKPTPKVTGAQSTVVNAELDAHVAAIKAAMLPASNTNAKPVNAKLDAIAAATSKGDVKTLLMMGYGSNNYGVKAAKLANASLKLLGSTHQVAPGQKMASHPGMKGGDATSTVAPSTTPAAAPSLPATPVKAPVLSMPDFAEGKTSTGVKAHYTKLAHKIIEHAAAGNLAVLEDMPGEKGNSWQGKTANSKKLLALHAAAVAQVKGGAPTAASAATSAPAPELTPKGKPPIAPKVADIASEANGPKEGDTKRGADGTLVFKNGRWHKLDDAAPAAAPTTVKVHGKTYKNVEDGHSKFWSVGVVLGGDGKYYLATHYGKIGSKGSTSSKPFATQAAAIAAQDKLVKQKTAKGYKPELNGYVTFHASVPAAPALVEQAPAAAPKVVGAAVPPEAASPESIDGWKKTGGQAGYNEGGTYVDAQGVAWYCKFPAGGEKIAKNELLAAKLYQLAGVDTAATKLVTQGGKVGLASKIIEGAKQDKAALLAGKAPGLLSGFAADAWLANWDVVGNNPAAGKGYDNILIGPDGKAVRIDAGGALLYGGAGGKKQKFENDVIELKTMLDPAKNAHTAAVFGKMSPSDIAASVSKVAAIPDQAIIDLCEQYGPGSKAERMRMADKLIARKQDMLAKYPAANKAVKPTEATANPKPKPAKAAKPDPTALKVDASLLPRPHDFLNWQGAGKPISDKPYVQQNIADEKAILAFALKGNLVALKDYKFQPVDKLTGQPTGAPLPMDKHPSNYVRDFYDNCVSFLEVVANPPEPLRSFSGKAASTVEQLAALFKPFDYGTSVAKAPANQRLGFWIALGSVQTPEKFMPAKLGAKLSEKAKAAAYETFKALPQTVKTFIHAVQGSGSNNQPYRDGKDVDHQGQDTRKVLTDLYGNAVSHPEGTTLNKWIEMPDSMVQQFLQEPPGLVFQNPGSMCTSQHENATKHFGKHRVVIHYAKGAAAIDTFGSGGFHGEAEITTLPGARFMVLSRKMVPDVEHGKAGSKRLELEVLMLPPDGTYVSHLKQKA